MNTKLTLTIDDSVIAEAKKYASRKGESLSALVENYLKSVTKKDKPSDKFSPIVKSLKGSFKAPEGFDYKKELTNALAKKYF